MSLNKVSGKIVGRMTVAQTLYSTHADLVKQGETKGVIKVNGQCQYTIQHFFKINMNVYVIIYCALFFFFCLH